VLLAQAAYSGETASGWQQVSLSTPVSIQANTTYVASYFTSTGYSVNTSYFTAAVDNPPLHALQNGTDGVNGVYIYSAASAFPNLGASSSNYWVDVVFKSDTGQQLSPAALPRPPWLLFTDLSQKRVYPNPWRADIHSGRLITFDHLSPASTVKIFTLSAHWVKTLDAPGGSASWDLTDGSGQAAASGFYIYLITDSRDNKSRGKLAIIR